MQSHTAPIAPATALTMEAYRTAIFRAGVVRRMTDAAATAARQTPAQVAAAIAAEQRALAQVLVAPEILAVASRALSEAQAALNPNPRYRSADAQARESIRQIMARRAAEAVHFAELLEQPDYVASLAAMSPAQADAATPALRDVKMQEVLGDLLHLEDGKPQVIAHIDATAKGAMLEHDALTRVFAADGALHDALMKGLSQALPTLDQPAIHRIASEWLRAREAAAKLTADLSANDGAAYIEAVRQSTAWHRQPHKAAPSTVVDAKSVVAEKSAPVSTATARRNAKEIEHEKTRLQRAEDISYTINHALSCGTTDVVLQPAIAAAFGINVGCGDSSHDHHAHDHGHAKPKLTLKTFAHEAGHYLKGEIIGDFAAVPLTIGVQRLFPNFMNGLRKLTEPLFGWAFRGGANRAARHWAHNEGIAPDAPEVKAHAEEIYQHEVSHLPQAVVWNMFAYPIGAVAQKMGGHGRSYPEIFKSKLVGALVSNTILIGGRMIAPGAAQKWDQVTGEKIFLPVSKAVGNVFGVDEKTMEKAADKNQRWAECVDTTAAEVERA